jgi:hypothetical protein
VSDAQQITPIGNVRGERLGNFAAALSQREQHHAGVGGQPAAVERSCDFLARNRWQIEAELIIVGHGGCGSEARRAQVVSTPTPYASSMPCAIPVSANRNPRE